MALSISDGNGFHSGDEALTKQLAELEEQTGYQLLDFLELPEHEKVR